MQQLARPSDRKITSLSFSPDGNLLAWTPLDSRKLHLWDVNNSRPFLFPPTLLTVAWKNVAFYPDGKHLAFIGSSGVPEVWNVVTRDRVYPSGPDDFRGARERGLSGVISLSADGAWVTHAEWEIADLK